MLTRTALMPRFIAAFARMAPRILLVVLLGFSAIDKLMHLNGFTVALHDYNVLPVSIERYAAFFVIMAEATIAIGLLTRRWRRSACLSAALLLGLFTTVYLLAAPEGTCGCWFTLTMAKGSLLHISQNLIFIGLAILTWLEDGALQGEGAGSRQSCVGLNPALSKGKSDGGKRGPE